MKKKILFYAAAALTAEAVISNHCLKTTRINVTDRKIPSDFDGYKIVQLSDLHSKSFGAGNYRLIKKIKKESPDIIVLTGDMINSYDDFDSVFHCLAVELTKIAPVYFVVGNHELQLTSNRREDLMHFLSSHNIHILDNEAVKLKRNDSSIMLYGLWFNLRYYSHFIKGKKPYEFSSETMDKLLGVSDNALFNLLLTHDPSYFETYAAWGANLTLSGHIHGGMVRLPFKGGMLSPHWELFPQYCAGLYRHDENHAMFVHSGLSGGYFGLRYFNRPGIAVITLGHAP